MTEVGLDLAEYLKGGKASAKSELFQGRLQSLGFPGICSISPVLARFDVPQKSSVLRRK